MVQRATPAPRGRGRPITYQSPRLEHESRRLATALAALVVTLGQSCRLEDATRFNVANLDDSRSTLKSPEAILRGLATCTLNRTLSDAAIEQAATDFALALRPHRDEMPCLVQASLEEQQAQSVVDPLQMRALVQESMTIAERDVYLRALSEQLAALKALHRKVSKQQLSAKQGRCA